MNLERFAVLAEAYGGDVARWPLVEREAAALLMAARPEATAPVERRAPAWRSWIWRTGLGAGLMAAGAAGVMAGVVASSAIAPTSVEFDVITAAVSASDSLDAEVVGDV